MAGPTLPSEGFTVDEYEDNLLIFGGRSVGGEVLQTLWHMEWLGGSPLLSPAPLAGAVPSPRYYHTSLLYQSLLYIIHGFSPVIDEEYRYSLPAYDIEAGTWRAFPTTGDVPQPRCHHTTTLLRGATAYMLGGFPLPMGQQQQVADVASGGPPAECYELNLESLVWTKVELPQSPTFDRGLWGHSAVAIGGRLVVYGGYLMGSHHDAKSLWIFEPGKGWRGVQFDSLPPATTSRVVAMRPFAARTDQQLSFNAGDVIRIVPKKDGVVPPDGWCIGETGDGRTGCVPLQYVRPYPASPKRDAGPKGPPTPIVDVHTLIPQEELREEQLGTRVQLETGEVLVVMRRPGGGFVWNRVHVQHQTKEEKAYLAAHLTAPAGRATHGAAAVGFESMLIYGGEAGDPPAVLQDWWSLNLSNGRWTYHDGMGSVPPPLAGVPVVFHKGVLAIVLPRRHALYYADMATALKWSKVDLLPQTIPRPIPWNPPRHSLSVPRSTTNGIHPTASPSRRSASPSPDPFHSPPRTPVPSYAARPLTSPTSQHRHRQRLEAGCLQSPRMGEDLQPSSSPQHLAVFHVPPNPYASSPPSERRDRPLSPTECPPPHCQLDHPFTPPPPASPEPYYPETMDSGPFEAPVYSTVSAPHSPLPHSHSIPQPHPASQPPELKPSPPTAPSPHPPSEHTPSLSPHSLVCGSTFSIANLPTPYPRTTSPPPRPPPSTPSLTGTSLTAPRSRSLASVPEAPPSPPPAPPGSRPTSHPSSRPPSHPGSRSPTPPSRSLSSQPPLRTPEMLYPGHRAIVVEKDPGDPLGMAWRGSILTAVAAGSVAHIAGAAKLIGQRVLKVNGEEVGSGAEVRGLAHGASRLVIEFTWDGDAATDPLSAEAPPASPPPQADPIQKLHDALLTLLEREGHGSPSPARSPVKKKKKKKVAKKTSVPSGPPPRVPSARDHLTGFRQPTVSSKQKRQSWNSGVGPWCNKDGPPATPRTGASGTPRSGTPRSATPRSGTPRRVSRI